MNLLRRRSNESENSYLWCDSCRRSFRHEEVVDGNCPVCSSSMRSVGKYAAIFRGLVSNELSTSPLYSKHRQMIKLIWSSNGKGEQYYRVIAPDLPYNKFEARVTELLIRGAEEGWVHFRFPAAPTEDESQYRFDVDEERFLNELETAFAAEVTNQ